MNNIMNNAVNDKKGNNVVKKPSLLISQMDYLLNLWLEHKSILKIHIILVSTKKTISEAKHWLSGGMSKFTTSAQNAHQMPTYHPLLMENVGMHFVWTSVSFGFWILHLWPLPQSDLLMDILGIWCGLQSVLASQFYPCAHQTRPSNAKLRHFVWIWVLVSSHQILATQPPHPHTPPPTTFSWST